MAPAIPAIRLPMKSFVTVALDTIGLLFSSSKGAARF
jgi:hypothetical protein